MAEILGSVTEGYLPAAPWILKRPYVDEEFACHELKNLKMFLGGKTIKLKQVVLFSHIMGIETQEETVFFKSVGMSLFVVITVEMYIKNRKEKILEHHWRDKNAK